MKEFNLGFENFNNLESNHVDFMEELPQTSDSILFFESRITRGAFCLFIHLILGG